jgi:hypothetical protein
MGINKEQRERIHAYLDGEFSLQERKAFEKEMASSPSLHHAFEEEKAMREQLLNLDPLPENEQFEKELFAKINRPKRLLRINLSQAIAASIAIVLVVGVLFMDRSGTSDQKLANASMLDNLSSVLSTGELTAEDVFNFAVHRQLPIDESNSNVLELGTADNGIEYFAIKPSGTRTSLDGFKEALKLSPKEAQELEGLLNEYAKDLQQDALLTHDKTVAVNAKLWAMNQALVADVFEFAERTNKNSFYKAMPTDFSVDYYHSLKKLKGTKRPELTDTFFVVTSDMRPTPKPSSLNKDSSKVRIKMIVNRTQISNGDSTITRFEIDTTLDEYATPAFDTNFFHIQLPSNMRAMIKKTGNAPFPDLDSTFDNYFNSARKHLMFFSNPDSFWLTGDENFFFDIDEDITFGFDSKNLNWDGDSGKDGKMRIVMKTMRLTDSLVQTQMKEKAYVGIFIRKLEKIDMEELGIEDGVYIDGIMSGSGAEEAGLDKADVITMVDKQIISSPDGLVKMLTDYKPGEKISVTFYRDGKKRTVKVTLKSRKVYTMKATATPRMKKMPVPPPPPSPVPAPSGESSTEEMEELQERNRKLIEEMERLREELEILRDANPEN